MLLNFGKSKNAGEERIPDGVVGDFYTSYDLWGMGFSRKMTDSDLAEAVILRRDRWEDTLWDAGKVDRYMKTPAAGVHFVAFRACRLRAETIKSLPKDYSPSAPWPENLIRLICGDVPDASGEDTLMYILSTLEERDADILLRRYREGESTADIASACGMSPSGVSSRIRSVLSELRNGFAFQMLLIGKEEYSRRIKGDPGALVYELPLAVRYKNVLLRNNIFAVCDLMCLSQDDIVRLPHGGAALAEEIAGALEAFGCPSPFLGRYAERRRKPPKIIREIGVVSEDYPGRKTRLDLVSLGDSAGYDIRQWTRDGAAAGEGITLSRKEAKALYELLGAVLSEERG